MSRYRPEHLDVFGPAERKRFLADVDTRDLDDPQTWRHVSRRVGWELCYRVEPELYDRLVAGEDLHPGILEWLPRNVQRAIEMAAGSGRLTVDLAPRCNQLLAVEPVAGLRRLLRRRVPQAWVASGFFDAIPARTDAADLVISCSAFTPDPAHGGEAGLRELERICAPGGLVVFVWPADPAWLAERGYAHETFDDERMQIAFASHEEAVTLARIFYPDAADEIAERGSRFVPYDVVGMNPPRDLCWKRVQG